MKSNAKSSITIPRDELRLVRRLKARLRLKSNVDVLRAGLRLLKETSDRDALKEAFRQASQATRGMAAAEAAELDHLAAEGVD